MEFIPFTIASVTTLFSTTKKQDNCSLKQLQLNSSKALFIALFLLIGTPISLLADRIEGKVLDRETGESITGAVVVRSNGKTGTLTDAEGFFRIEGTGNLQVSFLGYKNTECTPDSTFITIQLVPEKELLESIEVVGRMSKQYNSEYSYSATKIAAKNTELPQSVSTVTKELMLDRQAFRLGEVVKNISGVSTVSFYNHYAIRGITQNAGDRENRYVNGMRTSQIYFNQPLSSNIERVEVVKGPSSVTFSNTDAGGTMNMVTKKPLLVDRKQITMSVGSFNATRAALDFTGPLNEEKSLLYRLNVGYENSLSFRDLMFKKAIQIAPTLSYVHQDKTRLNFELVLNQDNSRVDRGQPIFMNGTEEEADLHSTPTSLSIGAPNDHYKVKDQLVQLSLSHSFTDDLTFNASYSSHAWDEDLSEYRSTFSHALDREGNEIPHLLDMKYNQRQQKWYTDNSSLYFNHTFEKGRLKSQTVVGADFIKFKNTKGDGDQVAQGYLGADGTTVYKTFDPNTPELYSYEEIDGVWAPSPNVPYFNIDNPSYEMLFMDEFISTKTEYDRAAYTTKGFYMMNRSEWGRVIVDLGLRREYYSDYENYDSNEEVETKQSAWLPKVGLTYKANKHVNVYAGYSRSYQPQTASVINNPNAGGPFDPLESRMYEIGAKTSFFDELLHANVALFDIEQKNILVSAQDPSNTDLLRQRGRETSKGVEFELIGQVSPQLNVNVAYAYIDAVIAEDSEGLAGQQKENTPKNNLSIWARYNFSQARLKGFGLGLGMNYVGEKLPWYSRDFMIPSYAVLDGALYYRTKHLNLALNVNNIANKTYWYGAINYTNLYPAAPRNGTVSLSYSF